MPGRIIIVITKWNVLNVYSLRVSYSYISLVKKLKQLAYAPFLKLVAEQIYFQLLVLANEQIIIFFLISQF